jgi:hypothetical protein
LSNICSLALSLKEDFNLKMLNLPDFKAQIRGDSKTNTILINALQGLHELENFQDFWKSRLTVTEASDNNVSISVHFEKNQTL